MKPLILDLDGLYGNDIITKSFSSTTWRIHKSRHAANAEYDFVTETFNPDSSNSAHAEAIGTLDFDSDGKMDVVIGDTSGYVSVFRNERGEGSRFLSNKEAAYQNVGFDVYFMDIGDVNNDGVDDIVVGGYGCAFIVCNGDGTWETKVTLTAPNYQHSYGGIKIMDIDG